MGVLLLIALIPVAIPLIIAVIPMAIGLIPVVAVLYVLGRALWFVGKLCWICWAGVYPFCCFCVVRRAERKVEMQNIEAKRRREEAVARTERVFEDLERGIHLAELQEVKTKETKAEDGTIVRASCSLDAHLPGGSMMDVVLFPVVQGGSVTSGLLLRLMNGTVDRYERLGVFEASHQQLKKLHHPSKDEIFLLF